MNGATFVVLFNTKRKAICVVIPPRIELGSKV